MKKAYYVPNFPIANITQTGEDGWCHLPNHPRMRYGYLDAVLEHIDNSNRIDPIQITIHDENQVYAGPSGVARLFALTHQRNYTHIPAIVSTISKYDWFGENVIEINTTDDLLSYFDPLYLPKSYSVDDTGASWSNHRPYVDDIERSMRVSIETKLRLTQMILEENK
jgi:hypothetical protein